MEHHMFSLLLCRRKKMKEDIENIFNSLQTLEIKSTISNMETLLKALYDLRGVYQKMIKEGEEGGGTEADIC